MAPAKVNLTLSIGPRRMDGYHDLHSVMVPLAFGDVVSVAPGHGPEDSLHVVGDPGPPRPDDLVLRGIAAARRTARAALGPSAELGALAARLEKRIPIAAGLAGGSSDAAAAFEAALEAWGVAAAVPVGERVAAAMAVGSDVPFFLAGGPAVVEGKGERVRPLRPPAGGPTGVVVVSPTVGISTAEVFRRYDAGGEAAPADPRSARITSEHLAQELAAGLATDQLVVRAGVLATANDLVNATAALLPALRALRRAVARHLGRPVGQSGSGPSLWAIYPSAAAAEAAAVDLDAAFANGSITSPGDRPPRIIATTIIGREP
jgi:4-diphosphocytidyl-2-C-methyl-D-erythritol kinase